MGFHVLLFPAREFHVVVQKRVAATPVTVNVTARLFHCQDHEPRVVVKENARAKNVGQDSLTDPFFKTPLGFESVDVGVRAVAHLVATQLADRHRPLDAARHAGEPDVVMWVAGDG